MAELLTIKLALIVLLGVTAAWAAWRIKLPSILLLIIVGILVGPIFGILNTDYLFGDLLNPFVSLSVAIILFEGGLSLDRTELKKIGRAVRGLLTIGVLITLILISCAAHYILKLDWSLSILLGSILVVTGPTVIAPMIRQIRPTGSVATVLKWEGIVIDPIGVTLAVIVFEIIILRNPFDVPLITFFALLKTAVFGGVLGYITGWLLVRIFKRNWVPHFLQNAFTLMTVFVIFAIANHFQSESGLLAVTVMGIMMASQKEIRIEHIVEFKENLQLLLIPSLFIILSSRITIADLKGITINHLLFLIALIFIVRPISVFISTIGSNLNLKEKIFLSWMAPRGIVAAAMSSIFVINLNIFGFSNYETILPTVFLVIIGTVGFYGLTSGPLAFLMKLADPNPQGILFIGGHEWARILAKILKDHGIKNKIIDTNPENIKKAKEMELDSQLINILAEHADEEIDLNGIGRLFAVTPNEQVNSMAALRFAPYLGKDKVYQLSSESKRSYKKKEVFKHIRGRILFSSGMTYEYISGQISNGAKIAVKKITKEDIDASTGNLLEPLLIPLCIISTSSTVRVFAYDNAPKIKEDEFLIYLRPTSNETPQT